MRMEKEALQQAVRAFSSSDALYSIARDCQVDEVRARELFESTKGFLLQVAVSGEDRSPDPTVDQAWHAFLLCTRDYARFCQDVLGKFVHHDPRAMGTVHGAAQCSGSTESGNDG